MLEAHQNQMNNKKDCKGMLMVYGRLIVAKRKMIGPNSHKDH